MTSRIQKTSWCFTLNNPTSTITEELKKLGTDPLVKYMIFQKEIGEGRILEEHKDCQDGDCKKTTPPAPCPRHPPTPHLQGYIVLFKKKVLNAMRKLIPGAHLAASKGSAQQNKTYCSKLEGRLEGPFEYGTIPEQGKRTDILLLKKLVDDGGTVCDAWNSHFSTMLKYDKALARYIESKPVEKREKSVSILFGPSGNGKTHFARNWGSPEEFYAFMCLDGKTWADGLSRDHKVVLLDEFYGNVKWSVFLQMIDSFPCTLEVKGGTVSFNPEKMFLTSNADPRNWYRYSNKMLWSALYRRVEHFLYFDSYQNWVQLKLPDPPVWDSSNILISYFVDITENDILISNYSHGLRNIPPPVTKFIYETVDTANELPPTEPRNYNGTVGLWTRPSTVRQSCDYRHDPYRRHLAQP